MAYIDIEIRNTIWTYIIPFSFLAAIVLIILTDSVKEVRERFFRWLMKDFGTTTHDKMTSEIKRALFADIEHIESKVIDLRNKGLVRILEIGVGSGTNLKYYPQQCRLVVVDPNVYFRQYFEENKAKFPDINLEKFVVSNAENLRGVASNSVDVVVTTTVLCSVESVPKVIKEIKRVLVPGGSYFFLEHTLDEPPSKLYQLQSILTWTNIWPWIFDGCKYLNIKNEVALGGFSKVDYKEFTLEASNLDWKSNLIAKLMAPHIVGIANK